MSWNSRFRIGQFRKNSLWLLPVIGMAAAIAATRLIGWIDQQIQLPENLTFQNSTANTMLSAIVAASISLTGFMLTILVLLVQISGSAYSPRTLLFVFRSRQLQISIALFLATTTFAFLLTARISDESKTGLGMLAAMGLMLFSVLFFLHTLSRLMHGIRPTMMADNLSATGHAVIHQIYPDPAPSAPTSRWETFVPDRPPDRIVRFRHQGAVLQAFDIDGLARLARQHDVLLVLQAAIADYVRGNGAVLHIYGTHSLPGDDALLGHLAFGSERTPEQDPAFALRVLVDVAIKALSAAINDPTTGEQMLDRIEDLLIDLVQRDLDIGVVFDDAHVPRLIFPRLRWDDFLILGVTEVRLYGGGDPQICRRLGALYSNLLDVAPVYRRRSIIEQLERLRRTVEQNFPDPFDRAIAAIPDAQGLGVGDEDAQDETEDSPSS